MSGKMALIKKKKKSIYCFQSLESHVSGKKSILFRWKCLHSHSDVILHMSHWGRWGGGQPEAQDGLCRESGTFLDNCEQRNSTQHHRDLKFCAVESHLDRFSPHSPKSSNESKKKKKSWNPILKSGSVFVWQWFLSLCHDGQFSPPGSTNKHQGILMFKKGSILKKIIYLCMQENAFDFNHQQDLMVSSGFLGSSSKWETGPIWLESITCYWNRLLTACNSQRGYSISHTT